ncbi:MAG: hypothetical protein JW843_09365 [Candidatus Aminicenantes bacterium]|nr:hypothetical protein [Candidatus Aminicenantes bacterium]
MIAGAIIVLVVYGSAQVIENSDTPKSPEAGRVIVGKEVLAITDETGEYFFKFPYGIKIGPDGSIAVKDDEQILRFDRNGKFIRNYFKKGHGPGEMTQVDDLVFTDDGHVIVHARNPSKLIWFDLNGTMEKEVVVPVRRRGVGLIGRIEKNLIFQTYENMNPWDRAGLAQIPHQLEVWNEQTNQWTPSAGFDCVYFVARNGRTKSRMIITNMQAAILEQGLIAIGHTDEYLIKILRLSDGTIAREFRRPYKRVPLPPLTPEPKEARLNVNVKSAQMPVRRFLRDISLLQSVSGNIWAMTSTRDKKKGVLVDVFDIDGIYRDAFYLKLPESALSRRPTFRFSPTGDAVFASEITPDETIVIKKYALK